MSSDAIDLATNIKVGLQATSRRTPLYAVPAALVNPMRVVVLAPRKVPAWLIRFFDLLSENCWLNLVVLPVDGEHGSSASVMPADLHILLRYEHRRVSSVSLEYVGIDSNKSVMIEAAVPIDLDIAALRVRVGVLKPDLILLLGASHWAESLGDSAKWGCWDFDSSLTDTGWAAQALLGPVMLGQVATQVELQLCHVGGPATTLVAGCGSTCRSSVSTQREQVFLKVPALLMRSLRQLAYGELQVPQQRTARLQLASVVTVKAGFGPGLQTFIRTMSYRLAARWQRHLQPYDTAWQVLIRHGVDLITPEAPDIRKHSILSAPGNRYWADPWVVVDAGRRLLFVEQWTGGDPKGIITCLELLDGAQVRPLGVVLERPFHLSYPQVFRWEGQWYLTVESGQDHCVSLYRAEYFPLRWKHVTNLISGWSCVDPTLYYHNQCWYLFVNVSESGGSTCDELFLFVSEYLEGPFRPHSANPIVSDARWARPAGRLFLRDGRLIRPSQDCAPSYGAAVVFNEVLELSQTHYCERPLGRLDTQWASGLNGCHTYNEADDIEVLDVRGSPPADSERLVVV